MGNVFAVGNGTIPYRIPTNLAGEVLIVTAEVEDNEGLTDSAQAEISILSDTIPPAIALTAPVDNLTLLETQNLNLRAAGFDNIAIDRVEFFINGMESPIASFDKSSIRVNSDNTFAVSTQYGKENFSAGDEITVFAVATDTAGNQGQSAKSTITILAPNFDDTDIEIEFPAENDSFFMERIVDVFTRTPAKARILKVELLVDDVLVETDFSKPFQFQYSLPTTPINQFYTIKVIATDMDNVTAEDTVVIEAMVDDRIPSVAIHEPSNLSHFVEGIPLQIVALASDNIGVDRVEFFVDGTLLATDTSGTSVQAIFTEFSISWTPPTLVPGEESRDFTLAAQAYDLNNNSSALFDIIITILDDGAPSVSIIEPRENRSFFVGKNIQIDASVEDDVKVTSIQAFSGGNTSFNSDGCDQIRFVRIHSPRSTPYRTLYSSKSRRWKWQ